MVGSVLVVAGAGDFGSLDPLGIGLALLGGLGQTFYVIAARHGFAHIPGAQAAIMTMAGAASDIRRHRLSPSLAPARCCSRSPASMQRGRWCFAGVVGAGLPTVPVHHRHPAPRPAAGAILATFEPVVGVALAALLLRERPASCSSPAAC